MLPLGTMGRRAVWLISIVLTMGWKGKNVICFAILIQGKVEKSGISLALTRLSQYYEILDKPQHYIFFKCLFGGWEIVYHTRCTSLL